MISIETYKAVAKRYSDRRDKLDTSRFSHFKNVFGNLAADLLGRLDLMELRGEVISEDRRAFVKSLRKVREYVRLVEKFPKFRDGEVNGPQGAFPDLYSEAEEDQIVNGNNFFTGYINRAKQRLEVGELVPSF